MNTESMPSEVSEKLLQLEVARKKLSALVELKQAVFENDLWASNQVTYDHRGFEITVLKTPTTSLPLSWSVNKLKNSLEFKVISFEERSELAEVEVFIVSMYGDEAYLRTAWERMQKSKAPYVWALPFCIDISDSDQIQRSLSILNRVNHPSLHRNLISKVTNWEDNMQLFMISPGAISRVKQMRFREQVNFVPFIKAFNNASDPLRIKPAICEILKDCINDQFPSYIEQFKGITRAHEVYLDQKIEWRNYPIYFLTGSQMLGKNGLLIPFEDQPDLRETSAVELSLKGTTAQFLSHRWELNDPDPGGVIRRFLKEHPNDLFWLDYCCLPQKNVDVTRVAASMLALNRAQIRCQPIIAENVKLEDSFWCLIECLSMYPTELRRFRLNKAKHFRELSDVGIFTSLIMNILSLTEVKKDLIDTLELSFKVRTTSKV